MTDLPGPFTEPIPHESMELTETQAEGLALRVAADHLMIGELYWENYPYLTEESFHMLLEAVNRLGVRLDEMSAEFDEKHGVDSVVLLDEAQ